MIPTLVEIRPAEQKDDSDKNLRPARHRSKGGKQ